MRTAIEIFRTASLVVGGSVLVFLGHALVTGAIQGIYLGLFGR